MESTSELLSISEMARLRKVTTETLRHYDRIGLFTPSYISPDTGYRYYSFMQYEHPNGEVIIVPALVLESHARP